MAQSPQAIAPGALTQICITSMPRKPVCIPLHPRRRRVTFKISCLPRLLAIADRRH
ncbi:hypothetical protein CYLTODRAFT_420450, partial [Cylindrobasidium torrendii FP15055 ss-10]